MPINLDKPHLWKADSLQSIDFYNDWFLRFAPATYRNQRKSTTQDVVEALKLSNNLKNLSPEILRSNPGILPMLRMTSAPPLARDRLVGLAYASKNLILSMEGSDKKTPRIPPKIEEDSLNEQLTRIIDVLSEVADRDLFPWLEDDTIEPTSRVLERSASVVADRLCGATANPIIRNAQEKRQLNALSYFLTSKGFTEVSTTDIDNLYAMPEKTYAFRLNVKVGQERNAVNIPIDCVVSRENRPPDEVPLLIEAKSAGDATNTNKRRKEEAQKFTQLKAHFGDSVKFVLFLCGYFETGYLGYEAAEGIDWIWEHRINDLLLLIVNFNTESEDFAKEEPASYSSDFLRKEAERLTCQKAIDSSKTQLDRNQLGQFSTPFSLAAQISSFSAQFTNNGLKKTMLEPACGSGVFFSAFIGQGLTDYSFTGIEIDSAYASICEDLFSENDVKVITDDFFSVIESAELQNSFDLIVTNPPYVRHHHINSDTKQQLKTEIMSQQGIQLSGLSGLYVYYIILCHTLLKEGGIASWLVPSEFFYTNYGKALREYLSSKVSLLRIHKFDAEEVQFDDALVSSCVITYKKEIPSPGLKAEFTVGNYQSPKLTKSIDVGVIPPLSKWNFIKSVNTQIDSGIVLSDLFHITRGIATGNNAFFILDEEAVLQNSIERDCLIPLLPSPRYLKVPVVESDLSGEPVIEKKRFLLSISCMPDETKRKYPFAWKYLKQGVKEGVDQGYLCQSRKVWYFQEKRDPPLYIATYMGRSSLADQSPIRFILNHSRGIVTNGFLCLYPRLHLLRLFKEDSSRKEQLLNALNSISEEAIKNAGRSYGGGLQKIEPKELRSLRLDSSPIWLSETNAVQTEFFNTAEFHHVGNL